MSFTWNPGVEDEIRRMAVRNLTPKYRAALAAVMCADHGEHPTIVASGTEWKIARCCDKAEALAFDAIRKVNAS